MSRDRKVEHTSHGTPLEDYVLTRQDHEWQKMIDQWTVQIREKEDAELRKAQADPVLAAQWNTRLREIRAAIPETPDHEIMRWRVRLYCGHIREIIRNVETPTPTMHGSIAADCAKCGPGRFVIVAWEPIGLKASPPTGERPGPVIDVQAIEREAAKLEAKAARLRAQLPGNDGQKQ